MEQAGQWPSSVAIDTHTLIGLGRGVDIINRLSEIQVVIKKFFLEKQTEQSMFRRWYGKVFQFLGAPQ